MQPQQDNTQKMVIVATLAFIVGFALAWIILSQRGAAGTAGNGATAASSTAAATATTSANFISVLDQPAGVQVQVADVKLDRLGWVVIHDDDNGVPGRILGAQLFDAGETSGTVDLLRGTLAGSDYFAVLQADNGDRAFEPKLDEPIMGSDGNPVMTKFAALATNNATTSQ